MRILVIGLGSMGKRRIRLLQRMRPDVGLCGVDMNEARRKAAQQEYGLTVYASITDAVDAEAPAAAIVSTAPLSHAAIIHECLTAGLHVFTEINLVDDGYAENVALAEEKRRVLFLSSTFLYREETRFIRAKVRACKEICNYRYHVGQYLPDWHPWEDYTQFFAGDSRTNGCRELFAIEMPWLIRTFGPVVEMRVIHNKMTKLKIGYDESYMLLLRHQDGHMGSLCVDVVSRKAVRLFELYAENLYLTWDGTPDTLRMLDGENVLRPVELHEQAETADGYASFIVENAYENELCAFLDAIETGILPEYGFSEDLETLALIDRIGV